jgi:hypothetical protein
VAGFARRSVVLVLARPHLWGVAVRQGLRIARPGWWWRPPFLPLPDRDYVRFRLETQYGDASPDPRDLVTYLEWCRAEGRRLGNGRTRALRRRDDSRHR